MKKVIALLLAMVMALALGACGNKAETETAEEDTTAKTTENAEETEKSEDTGLTAKSIKIGMVMIGDKADKGYNYNHVVGIEAMEEALGISDDQIVYKENVAEGSESETAIRECVEAGCNIVFANSFGFEDYMLTVAEEYPDVQFCHASGFKSASDELDNTHNYFAGIHEARYLAGIAAGMKTENNHLGYVAAKPFAEVISGFTAFYLGAKSVNPDVKMDVIYTNEWSDPTKEAQSAQALIDGGCDVISQHSDTTAPATTAQANGIWQVGYNADMIEAAPDASLISARIAWGVYYTETVQAVLDGEEIPQDWCEGLSTEAVFLSPLNTDIAADGTQEAIDTAKAELVDGTRHVFDGPLAGTGVDFDGSETTIDLEEGEYFHEGEETSAPAWNYIIDGINIIE